MIWAENEIGLKLEFVNFAGKPETRFGHPDAQVPEELEDGPQGGVYGFGLRSRVTAAGDTFSRFILTCVEKLSAVGHEMLKMNLVEPVDKDN